MENGLVALHSLSSTPKKTLKGAADIGISLHSSSSGLDLPMKVVDMLGCDLPVLALDFSCLDELVIDGHNGLTFSDAVGLERGLETVLGDYHDHLNLVSDSEDGDPGNGEHDNWLRRNLVESTAFPTAEDGTPALRHSLEQDNAAVGDDTIDAIFLPRSGSADAVASALEKSSPVLLDAAYSSVETSPNASTFSLLADPRLRQLDARSGLSQQLGQGESTRKRRKTDTWRGNWKRVVRPLLSREEADEREGLEEEDAEAKSKEARLPIARAFAAQRESSSAQAPARSPSYLFRPSLAARASKEGKSRRSDEQPRESAAAVGDSTGDTTLGLLSTAHPHQQNDTSSGARRRQQQQQQGEGGAIPQIHVSTG